MRSQKVRQFPGVGQKGGGSRGIETRALSPPCPSLARGPGKMLKPRGLSSSSLKPAGLRSPYAGLQDVPEGCDATGKAWQTLAL